MPRLYFKKFELRKTNLLKVPNKEKEGWNYRTVKTYLHYEKE